MPFKSSTVNHFFQNPDQLILAFDTLASTSENQAWHATKVDGIKVLTIVAARDQKMEADVSSIERLLATDSLCRRFRRLLKAARGLNETPSFEEREELHRSLKDLAQRMDVFAEVPAKFRRIKKEIFGILPPEDGPSECPIGLVEISPDRQLECPGCHQIFDREHLVQWLKDGMNNGCPCCRLKTIRNSVFNQLFEQLTKEDIDVPHEFRSSGFESMLHHVIRKYEGPADNLVRMVCCLIDQGYSFENTHSRSFWLDGMGVRRPLFSFLKAERGGLEIASYALEKGQKISGCMHEKVGLSSVEERTLHWWAREGEYQLLIWAFNHGADLTVLGYKGCDLWSTLTLDGVEPVLSTGEFHVSLQGLLRVFRSGYQPAIEAVIQQGNYGKPVHLARMYDGPKSIFGEVHSAVSDGRVAFLKNLIRCGYTIPDPWPCEHADNNILMEALFKNRDEMVVYLLQLGHRHPKLWVKLAEGEFPEATAWAKANIKR